MMHARLLAASSLSMAAAAGVSLGFLPVLPGLVAAAALGVAAAALTRWRDDVVGEAALGTIDPPSAPNTLTAGTRYYPELIRVPDPGFAPSLRLSDPWTPGTDRPSPVANDDGDADYVIPVPPLVPRDFAMGDAVEFTFNHFEHGTLPFEGVIVGLPPGRASVQCDHVRMSVPLRALTYVGDR